MRGPAFGRLPQERHAGLAAGGGEGIPSPDQEKEPVMFNVEEELKKLPKEPGVYIMRDDKDVILYVGKAVNIHNRVRSYFR